ncbi:hypothetical protein GX51_05515 [Blastomyces parvus]|uniref:Uncharacterized protein n=1 Tax=Blastomyces parvus TaxID=2060905 RepID=A0A2B7WVY5_9EURO|nr:hypothetical protein GX51_05515 [Blastomyces parvus]
MGHAGSRSGHCPALVPSSNNGPASLYLQSCKASGGANGVWGVAGWGIFSLLLSTTSLWIYDCYPSTDSSGLTCMTHVQGLAWTETNRGTLNHRTLGWECAAGGFKVRHQAIVQYHRTIACGYGQPLAEQRTMILVALALRPANPALEAAANFCKAQWA